MQICTSSLQPSLSARVRPFSPSRDLPQPAQWTTITLMDMEIMVTTEIITITSTKRRRRERQSKEERLSQLLLLVLKEERLRKVSLEMDRRMKEKEGPRGEPDEVVVEAIVETSLRNTTKMRRVSLWSTMTIINITNLEDTVESTLTVLVSEGVPVEEEPKEVLTTIPRVAHQEGKVAEEAAEEEVVAETDHGLSTNVSTEEEVT